MRSKNDTTLMWLWLSLKCSPGTRTADIMLESFGNDIQALYEGTEDDYGEIEALRRKSVSAFLDKDLTEASEIYSYCSENSIGILTPDNELYPARLKRIQAKPTVLYYRGKLIDLEDNVCISMVGTRSMTEYGKHSAYSLSYDIGRAGAIVVSGMARGIDGMCHRGCLDGGGYTVAVLGCGIDRVYPPEHDRLMDEIIKNGLVITEFKPFTPPNGKNFPIRNRIMSGLSLGTVVIEADERSGAMITARTALLQGRDIYALPGKVGEFNSIGTNTLIKNGAKMVTGAEDILLEYTSLYPHKINLGKIKAIRSIKYPNPIEKKVAANPTKSSGSSQNRISPHQFIKPDIKDIEMVKAARQKQNSEELLNMSESERKVFDILGSIAMNADEIARAGVPASEVMAALTLLEIKQLVRALPGGVFIRTDALL